MKILFLTDNFFPETNAPAKRTLEHATEWINLGHSVTIITGVPNFPKGIIFKGYRNKFFQEEYIENIHVKRVWTYVAANKGFLIRIIDYLSFMFSSFICGIFTKKHDVIIATSPQFFTLISGFLISKVRNTPLVIEIRDLWPESVIALGAVKKNNFLIKILFRIANYIYKKADIIVVVTDSFKKHLTNLNINEKKIVVIKNGFNFKRNLIPDKTETEVKALYNLNTSNFVVSYIGTVGMAHGVDIVLRTAKKIKNVTFFIVGEGAEKEKLIKQCKKINIRNIKFIDNLDWQEIVNINQIIDVNLIHLKDLEIFKTVIPSKIFESMALGKPILAGLSGESLELIQRSNSGLKVVQDDENSLIERIRFLKSNKQLLQSLSKNGIDYVKKNHDRKKLAVKMIKYIESTIN